MTLLISFASSTGRKENAMNNAIIKEADFRKQIKSTPAQGYLFFGEEDYMKKFALDTAICAISPDPTFAFFNEIRLDSFSYTPDSLIDALMPAPMMADRKIVIISGLDFTAMKQGEIDALCKALESLSDYEYNTLIINTSADRFDEGLLPRRPSAALQKLSEHLVPVQFEKNTPARLAAWIAKHFEHNGVRASQEICSFIVDRCGRDMFNLVSETDKLSFYVLSQGRDTVVHEDVLSVSTPVGEYDAFAFTNAISARRRDEALDILGDMKCRRLEPLFIISEITKTVCDMLTVCVLRNDGFTQKEIAEIAKLHEYRVGVIMRTLPDEQMCKRMLLRCRDADFEIKSSRGGYSVLERLICTI